MTKIRYCEFCKEAILPDENRMQYGLKRHEAFVHVPGCGSLKEVNVDFAEKGMTSKTFKEVKTDG